MAIPWEDYEDFIFRQLIILICTARFSDMESIAVVLAALKNWNGKRNFVVAVLDHTFEQFIRGLEENDFKDA